jgi:putative phage-type endonuclease
MSLSPEALAMHHGGIGSSDVATILGLNRYETNFALWEVKCGLRQPEDISKKMEVRLGIKLEPVVAELFEEDTGKTLHNVNKTQVHPQYPWLRCNLDRRVVGERALAEIKTAGYWAAKSEEWGEEGTEAVPFRYASQIHEQLAVTGYEVGYLPLLDLGNRKLKIYEIKRDEDLISKLIPVLAAFWHCVETRTPPEPITLNDAKEQWPSSDGTEIEATADVRGDVILLAENGARAGKLKKEREVILGRVAAFMGASEILTYGGKPIFTYKRIDKDPYTVGASHYRNPVIKKGVLE